MLLPEWHPQSMVLLSWPHADSDWGSLLAAVQREYLALAAAVTARQPLVIACHDHAHRQQTAGQLHAAGIDRARCTLVSCPVDDTWIRDYGPLGVMQDGNVSLVAFRFNAWGGKYPHTRDAAFTATLHRQGLWGATPLHADPLVAEGGALETDGEGLLLTTRGCIDAASRNPGLSRETIDGRLCALLGIERVAWLEVSPLAGDDTDGHVDTLARFAPGGHLLHVTCSDPSDPHYAPLAGLREQLAALRDRQEHPFKLVDLPLPEPLFSVVDGRRLAASYANFLVINGAVLCPEFGAAADLVAQAALRRCFPGRAVVPVPSRILVEQNGSLHCASCQLPAGVALEWPGE
jgi:agmatine/peptidylarginine deiminase